MTTFLKMKSPLLNLAAVIACALVSPAFAAGPSGDAGAYDLSVHINLIGVTALDVDAQTSAAVTNATSSVDDLHQLASFSAADPLALIHLDTGALSSEAAYAGGNFAAVAAQSTVDGLNLNAVGSGSSNVLSVLADVVVSRSVLAGRCPPPAPRIDGLLDDFIFLDGFDGGNLVPVGGDGLGGLPGSGADLGNLTITILGIPVPIPVTTPPNTTIDLSQLGIAGATLILNEQTLSGDGVHDLGMLSNAIHLTLDVAGLVTANVIIAHSEAALHCP